MKKTGFFRAERRDCALLSRSRSAWYIIILIIALLLSACGSASGPTPIPTVVLDSGNQSNSGNSTPVSNTSHNNDGSVTASAVIVPVQEAQLAFSLPGSIQKVNVAAGDQVKEGDLLAELENASIQLEVEAAQRSVRELTSAAAIAAAEQAVANTQKIYDDAKKKVDSTQNRHADNITIDYLEDQVTLAQDALDRAREAYKQTAGRSDRDPLRAKAATNLYNAQKAYNTALGNLNWYANPPSANDIALANADLDAAIAALQEAQWYLAELKGESVPAEATGTQLAQLQQARANLAAAQDKLAHTQLHSPISGVVTTVDILPGEYVVPGQVLVAISNVNHLQVKTTDLSERDIIQVQVGDPARITVEALSQDFEGTVTGISPVANTLGGDVVYEVTIAFTEQPEGLLGGMSAEVTIGE
jgi:multidrug efflux pump subunit AcrA (membrane-fusion protein)